MNLPVHPLLISPHRGFFLLGMTSFIGVMAWWIGTQGALEAAFVPPGWRHSWSMVFGVFTPFIYGFLFTAYSRWLGTGGPSRLTWLLVLACQFTGTAGFITAALLGYRALMVFAVLAWFLAMLLTLGHLVRARMTGSGAWLHSLGAISAITAGLVSLGLLASSLGLNQPMHGMISVNLAFWSYLMGLYLVVAHRMLPFFAGCVLKPYTPYRPASALIALLLLANLQMIFRVAAQAQLQWLALLPMTLICAWLAWRWQFWRAAQPRLLLTLFIGWGGLITGLAVGSIQGLLLYTGQGFWAPRAPEHLIGIGFFAAMVIAMGTRVTLGHSGRPLAMGSLAWWAMLALLLCAALRVMAELTDRPTGWLIASAVVWIAAGFAWSWRYAPMLIMPRADQKPG